MQDDPALTGAVTRAKIRLSQINGRTILQLDGLDQETFEGVELLLPPGYVANPAPSATADPVILTVNGLGSHKIALCGDDTADAVTDLQPGEIGLSRDGRRVLLRLDHIEMVAPLLQWMAAPGGVLQRLVTEAMVGLFNGHTHGGGPTPDQQMSAAQLTGGS